VVSKEARLASRNLRLSALWVLQPDYRVIISSLQSRGYTTEGLERGPSSVQIGKKGTVTVEANLERRALAVESQTSIRDLVEAYSELTEINEEIGTDMKKSVFFHEFVGDFDMYTRKSPLETLNRLPVKSDIVAGISQELGKPIAPFTIRFGLKDVEPSSQDWLDIRIEPMLMSAKTRYFLGVVYRSSFDEVIPFVKSIEGKLKGIIEILEKETR